VKIATRVAIPLCTSSAACSAPAPPESDDTTMMSAEVTGSFATSAHPAARRTSTRRGLTATVANAPNATTIRIRGHLGRLEIMLGFIGSHTTMLWHLPASITIPGRDVQRPLKQHSTSSSVEWSNYKCITSKGRLPLRV
jgi:hypothetical protein